MSESSEPVPALTASPSVSNASASPSLEQQQSSHVYVMDEELGWVPAELVSKKDVRKDGRALVIKKRPPKSKPVRVDGGSANVQASALQLSSEAFMIASSEQNQNQDKASASGGFGKASNSSSSNGLEVGIDGYAVGDSRAGPSPSLAASLHKDFDYADEDDDFDDDDDDDIGVSQGRYRNSATTSASGIPGAVEVNLSDYPGGSLPLRDVQTSGGERTTRADMCDLPYLHEASILYNLKDRFEGPDGAPYTRTGDIIVAINPYRWIKGLYADRTRHLYAEQFVWKANPRARAEIEPHIYETSARAFNGLIRNNKNQSILVSGESGAGKTVSVKILMSHLATFHETKSSVYKEMIKADSSVDVEVDVHDEYNYPFGSLIKWISQSFLGGVFRETEDDAEYDVEAPPEPDDEPEEMNQTNLIVQRVLDSNPLLEAFGNAKTPRNDNSSRFSKYVKLQFHLEFLGRAFPSCNIAGSRCETYLLEKSRVVHHESSKGERTFHIFYQLLAAPESYKKKLWDGLSLADASSFKYIGVNNTKTIEGLSDKQRWLRTLAALGIVGIKGEKLTTLMRALCVVLQLGNLVFSPDPKNEEASILSSRDELDKLSDILGAPAEKIESALILRKVTAGKVATKDFESLIVPMSTAQAKDTCDAFAKEIYSRTFDWLVGIINSATCAEENYNQAEHVDEFGVIGLLDIFGFESFESNHFEQLCINHANERLQHKFTEDVFRSVKREYKSEGLDLTEVVFKDNSDVLSLLEGKMGLVKLLNEECVRPQGRDTVFVNKVYANNKKPGSPLIYERRYQRHEFGINHFAGPVTYDATNFVVKNIDTLPEDVIECGVVSTNELISKELRARKEEKMIRKGSLMSHTVWTKFSKQLTSLMDDIGTTRTWYIRCINPNMKKLTGVLDLKYTVTQLRYSGIVSAVTISREAFPNRLAFAYVMERFWFLAKYEFLKTMKRSEMNVLFDRIMMRSDDATRAREDVEVLLDHLLKSRETVSSRGTVVRAFLCGKTRVYFRGGALEFLESERLTAYDRCATTIQSRMRRNLAVMQYRALRANPPQKMDLSESSLQKWAVSTLIQSNPFLPFTLMLFRSIVGFPSWLFTPRRMATAVATKRRSSTVKTGLDSV